MIALLVTGALAVLDTLMHVFASVWPPDPISQAVYSACGALTNSDAAVGYALWFTPMGSIVTFCLAWWSVMLATNLASVVVSFVLDHFTIAV